MMCEACYESTILLALILLMKILLLLFGNHLISQKDLSSMMDLKNFLFCFYLWNWKLAFIFQYNSLQYQINYLQIKFQLQIKNMRSIKNQSLNQSIRQTKVPSLASIQKKQSPNKGKRQKIQVQCAFHTSQIITNFCKNINCLLPLCPKCVKIHIEQHTQLGNFARIQTIDECLDQAHDSIMSAFSHANKLQKTSIELQQTHKKKKQQTLRQLQKAKFLVLQRVGDIFKQFQQAIRVQLNRQDRLFTEQLIQYHNLMTEMMQNFRNSSKKFTNKANIMEGLISYYAKGDFPTMLRQCQQRINNINICKIEITTKEYQLERLEESIRRFIRIGDNITSLQKLSSQNKMYPPVGRLNKQNQIMQNHQTTPIYSVKKFDNQLAQLDKIGGLQNLKTPLDKFSLELSRNTRMRIEQQRKTNNLY